MEPIYRKQYTILSTDCDPYQRIKPSAILALMQDVAVTHCQGTPVDWLSLSRRNLFFAITRQHVQITRLPRENETITLETWPGVTSRVAYPRNTIAYDAAGKELFRAISLWVLMDMTTRAMVLPGKSGVALEGSVRGGELPVPASIGLAKLEKTLQRPVYYSELDRNGHMNNCRYLDWVQDLLPSAFHREHPMAEFTICYHAEGKEGDTMTLRYELDPQGALLVNGETADQGRRVFAVRAAYL